MHLGITLVEMMVAISVAIILTLMAIPLFSKALQNHRLSTATEQLYNVLQEARSEAVKRNANVYVSFHTGDTWCYGVKVGSVCDCSVASSCDLGTYSYTTAQQLSLTTTLNNDSFYFEGTHGAAYGSGTITYTSYGSTPYVQITVSQLGSMKICSNSLASYAGC